MLVIKQFIFSPNGNDPVASALYYLNASEANIADDATEIMLFQKRLHFYLL